MSAYSAPVETKVSKMEDSKDKIDLPPTNDDDIEVIGDVAQLSRDSDGDKHNVSFDIDDSVSLTETLSNEENGDVELIPLVKKEAIESTTVEGLDMENPSSKLKQVVTSTRHAEFTGGKIIKRRKKNDRNQSGKEPKSQLEGSTKEKDINEKEELIHFCGKFSLTKRQLGLIGAITNGVWGSNNMIPMHYAR